MRLLMLDIDGLQPACLGPYGCEWAPTPTLDHWAATGVAFDQHYSDCLDPAVMPGWRTAWHPLAADHAPLDLLAELAAAGITTARVGPSHAAADWQIELALERDAEPLLLKPIRRAVRRAIEQMGDAANAFLRVEIEALFPPWTPSDEALAEQFADSADEDDTEQLEPWTESLPDRLATDDDESFARIQSTYAAAVSTLDVSLGKLLADCSKRGWGEDALWLLTARRGFPLGEHGPVGFSVAEVHEESVHVPLLWRWPNSQHAGHRIGSFTQPPDLGASLRELFGLPIVAAKDLLAGRSLVALASDGDTPVRDRAITGLRRAGGLQWGYRVPGWYLMVNDSPEIKSRLFVKPDDRWEVNDVSSRNQDLVEEMEREFRGLPSFRRAAQPSA